MWNNESFLGQEGMLERQVSEDIFVISCICNSETGRATFRSGVTAHRTSVRGTQVCIVCVCVCVCVGHPRDWELPRRDAFFAEGE